MWTNLAAKILEIIDTDELRSVVEKCKNKEQAYELKISEH